jgi:hypothetical protein
MAVNGSKSITNNECMMEVTSSDANGNTVTSGCTSKRGLGITNLPRRWICSMLAERDAATVEAIVDVA